MNASLRLRVLPQILPIDGRSVELRATDTQIQWRYSADHHGEYDWTDLIALSELVGPEGPATEFQVADGFIQYRPIGTDEWSNLVSLADITGPEGGEGPRGLTGAPGDGGALESVVWAEMNYHPQGAPAFLDVAGHAYPDDAGGARYRLVDIEPSHAGKFSITLEDGVTVAWFELAESTINPIMIGAAGNGDGQGGGTNDHDALEATFAVAAAIGAREVTGLRSRGVIYRVDDEVSYVAASGGLGFILSDMAIDYVKGEGDCLVFSGGEAPSSIMLSSDALRGNEAVDLINASSLAVGDYVYLSSGDDKWQTNVSWCEIKRITGIASDTVSFGGPLEYNYNASASAYVRKLNYLVGMQLRDVDVSTTTTLTGSRRCAIKLKYCDEWSMERVSSSGMRDRAVVFDLFTKDGIARDPFIQDCDRNGTGYGILASTGTDNCKVVNLTAERCRHPTSSGGSGFMVRNFVVYDSVGRDSLGGFDCHPEADQCGWVNCRNYMSSEASSEDGFTYQGNRPVFEGNESYFSTRYGALFQPLFTNAAGAPTIFVIGKLVAEGYAIGALRFSATTGAAINLLSIDCLVARHSGSPGGPALSIGLTGGTTLTSAQVLNPQLHTPSSAYGALQVIASGSGRVVDFLVSGGQLRSGTTLPLIDINTDASASTTWVSVDGVHALIGGTYAIRGVNANTKFKAHSNGYRNQATAFSSYASTGNSEANNWAM